MTSSSVSALAATRVPSFKAALFQFDVAGTCKRLGEITGLAAHRGFSVSPMSTGAGGAISRQLHLCGGSF